MSVLSVVRLGVAVLLALLACAADAARIALVIGNGAYRDEAPLKNPVNDARDVAAALGALGFEVVHRENVAFADMIALISEFLRRAPAYEVRLVYYAGHGVQVGESNYLVPVDAVIAKEDDVRRTSVVFDDVFDRLTQIRAGINLVILDACRSNPFSQSFAFGTDGRPIKKRGERDRRLGLAPPNVQRIGSLIAYSTTPGSLALDLPAERNSVYAKHLLRHLGTPGLEVEDLFKRVRKGVRVETQGLQVPWEHTSLEEPLCLAPAKPGPGGCGGS